MDKQKFWDPLGEKINANSYELQNQKHLKQLEYYRANPNRISEVSTTLSFIPIIVFLFTILFSHYPLPVVFWSVGLSLIPIILYRSRISNLQQNLALLLMCQKQGWVFSSEDDSQRMDTLVRVYKQVFDQGHSRTLSDQIWGVDEGIKTPFWRTSFTFVIGSGKSRSTHYRSIYMIPLPKNIETSFVLSRRAVAVFEQKIKTESEEFNTKFSISAEADSSAEIAQILKVLSPSVQVRLIDLARLYSLQSISFLEDVVVFEFFGDNLKLSYTNFSKKVEIDPRDVENLASLIRSLVDVPTELLQFID